MSSNPSIKQNVYPDHPELKDLLDLLKKDILLSLNSHHIGTVQSFDSSKQMASATINYKQTFFSLNEAAGTYDPVLVDYPVLMDCPVLVLGGGSASLTFPITKGDECLVLFNDRNLDNWLQSGGGGGVASGRLHSFADGIILVGLRSLPYSISSYNSTHAELRNGNPTYSGAAVGVSQTHIKIYNNITTLNTLLQSLLIQIEAITVTGIQTGSGTSGPIANAAAIAAIGVQIGGLLE